MSFPLKPEKGRYHLYVSLACPFAHRALAGRHLKKLEEVLPLTIVEPKIEGKDADGVASWPIVAGPDPAKPLCTPDPVFGAKFIRAVYLACDPAYADRFSVPLLIDVKEKKIVSTDSLEILKHVDDLSAVSGSEEAKKLELYPAEKRAAIDALMEWIGPKINGGVYSAGFARDQASYTAASKDFFDHLDKAEQILAKSRFLTGDKLTVADICLFTCLVRFDSVYSHLFKLVHRRIPTDYPNLQGFISDVYHTAGLGGATVVKDHIFQGFYQTASMNPNQLIPYGLEMRFDDQQARRHKFGVK